MEPQELAPDSPARVSDRPENRQERAPGPHGIARLLARGPTDLGHMDPGREAGGVEGAGLLEHDDCEQVDLDRQANRDCVRVQTLDVCAPVR